MYRLATRAGVMSPCFNVASLLLVSENISPESMGLHGLLDNDMAMLKDDNGNWKQGRPLRTHANASSKTGGQGMIRCSCSGKCDTKSCSCRKAGRECNSRCHKQNTVCCNLVRLE
jgi:hypothetical protein